MIRYALACNHDHPFEAWFGSSSDYDDQAARGLVECPFCGSHAVSKQIMAPAVAGLLWLFLYNGTFGWYHWIFQSLGILESGSILSSAKTSMYAIVLVDVWQWTPLITLIALAGLKGTSIFAPF